MLASEWEMEHIDPAKLPDVATIFDVIFSTPEARERFRDELKKRYVAINEFEGKSADDINDENIDKIIDAVYHQIEDIELTPDVTNVLLPLVQIHNDLDNDNEFRIITESSLFKFDELQNCSSYANETPITSIEQLHHSNAHNDYMAKCSINGYAYEFSPWNEILAYKVYVPSHITEKQCYEFYVDIFWEMTFFGIDRGEVEQRQQEIEDELDESMREYEQWKEEGTLDEHLIKPDLDKFLTDHYGLYKREYMKKMSDYELIMSYNFTIMNARCTIYDLYEKVKNSI